MKKKILIVAHKLDVGGVEKSLISLLQSIDYSKYKIDLMMMSTNGLFSKHIPKEISLIKPPDYFKWILIPSDTIITALKTSIGINLNILKLLYYILRGLTYKNMGISRQLLWKSCSKKLKNYEGQYDVAIDYTGWYKSFIIDKINATKKITWIHSDYKVYKRDKQMDCEDYRRLDAIVTVSKTCYDIFVSEFPQYKDKTYTIPNISNKNQIHKMALEEVDFDNDYLGIKILDIARLDPYKGLDIAIKACKKLIEDGYDIKWYILGDGPERHKLEKLIEQNNLQDKFILLGLEANPYPYIKRTDLIVHCSLFEGKSVAIDEAMLLAKPIILTNYPTAKDQIENGINGLICNISVEGVSNAVKLLISNNEVRRNLIMNLQDFDLSAKESIDKFYSIIDNK